MQLQRQLNSTQLWAITVGMVISGQYFGWNYGLLSGVTAFIIATAIVSIFYISFMLTYTQLAVSMPSAGGPMLYAMRAGGNRFACTVGLACLFEFLFAIPAIAIASGGYAHFLIPALNPHICSVALLSVFIIINLWPLKNSAKIELIATSLALIGLIIFYYIGIKNAQHSTSIINKILPQQNFMHAIPFAIWLYLAIEGGALTAEEVKQPNRTLPRGLIAAIITILSCSLLTVFALVHLKSNAFISDYPLVAALAHKNHPALTYCITICGLFALIASLNGIIIAASRQLFSLARAGFVSKRLDHLASSGTPTYCVLAIGVFTLCCVLLANIAEVLIELSVLAAMLMYLGAIISWFILDKRGQLNTSGYKIPLRALPSVALITCLVCLYALLRYSIYTTTVFFFNLHISLLYITLGLACIGALIYRLKHRDIRV